jgi:hypothetical protein
MSALTRRMPRIPAQPMEKAIGTPKRRSISMHRKGSEKSKSILDPLLSVVRH